MFPPFQKLSHLNYESCQFAKHHRSSYVPRVNKQAATPFELIHSDVWGPSLVLSKFEFRYFVTFIDDYSRVTWLHLMRKRSELLSIFSAFCAEKKLNLMFLCAFYKVIMQKSIFPSLLIPICHKMEFFISLLVLTPHLKIVL